VPLRRHRPERAIWRDLAPQHAARLIAAATGEQQGSDKGTAGLGHDGESGPNRPEFLVRQNALAGLIKFLAMAGPGHGVVLDVLVDEGANRARGGFGLALLLGRAALAGD